MNRKDLDKRLNEWIKDLPQEDRKSLLARLSGLKSVFPFNEYEYRLMYLLDKEIISFKEYEVLRKAYVDVNPYLRLYGIAPRVFGEIWAQQHLVDIDQRFKKPSKEIDKNYSGDYDLYLKNDKKIIKIEVKASRAINTKVRGGLEETALNFKSKEPYWMNFQQLKLDMADAFVFIGVWIDKIIYWVLTNDEVRKHPTRSHQHRGGIEYQIGITNKNFNEFKQFIVKPTRLVSTIKKKVEK
ncbi:MAG: hypothetical protein A3I88_03815 [Candidatus Portnoybacteria bacterium RIFCSPLOWO2_12_FULL_39_9]|uniref:Uncharacterized protein n=1 Tax=Candidatus Portnoybacteria bacterium RIFCSPHIGHO2_12_FULL_38_9 TaxID=1801997 RepID=A0A1G2FFP4_9BACT|nr:MAG: hypothetical protein A3H00_01725 [Candidatus Portnoybacteria bacterium RBG_13_40_8]OGZ35907.1 MAG: hypothetical protein A2646_01835 [Candidatus Portnoybacteria bacterium RIFCSPHIGHO2_02_FULL_39_12]OGZ36428.1 MAG: hypothetical protein A3J64_02225 [Candidatus Portnoybacteria bacterium RIFCSPHIGHO2_12_FULL_38_9]OGZ39245.1 MAG: hypothetical protein A3F21_01545 [Candidatus Portnoybacteria bacterium RIFCSPLOWO2_01_FULL_38_39]OGZ40241.1 MAG: hypothetical protein A3I88_03815 [Candidatus Portnoy